MEEERFPQTSQVHKGSYWMEYCEGLYAMNFDNLEETEESLEIYNLPKLNHKEMDNLNRLRKLKQPSKTSPQNKSSGPDGFTSKFYQTFNKCLIPILLKLVQKTEEEAICPNTFYVTNVTLTPRSGKDEGKRENYKPIISDEQRCKNPKQNARK